MSFGLVELITLLLSLSGFSLQQNPKAVTADQALQYAMPDADLVMHLDARAVIGNNYKLLLALPNQPQIKSSPDLSKTVRKAINEVDGLKGIVKTVSGVDLATDVSGATIFVQAPAAPRSGPPAVLISVRGKFAMATIDKLAKMAGPATRVGGGAMIELPPGQFPFGAIAVTKDGTFLAGSPKLLKDRLAGTWSPPPRPAGSNLAHAASVLVAKPVFAMILTMSQDARKQAIDSFQGQKNFITDVVTRHKLAAFSMFHDGIGWTWIDSNSAGLDAMAQISEGAFDVLRAGQIAPRGMAKMMMGALESYRGNPQVDAFIRRKADLWKIVESYTGDGNFKVTIDKNPATLRLVARGTGKSLSDVVPAGMLLPGAMLFLVGTRSAKDPAMTSPAPPAQPPRLSPSQRPITPKPAPPRPRK
jgi:hypothetical protein